MLKSAFELAIEKTGGEIKKLSEETKLELSKIDAEYKIKLDEQSFKYSKRIQDAKISESIDECERIEAEWQNERAKLISERDRLKDGIRNKKL